jgi:hypothetical protein
MDLVGGKVVGTDHKTSTWSKNNTSNPTSRFEGLTNYVGANTAGKNSSSVLLRCNHATSESKSLQAEAVQRGF